MVSKHFVAFIILITFNTIFCIRCNCKNKEKMIKIEFIKNEVINNTQSNFVKNKFKGPQIRLGKRINEEKDLKRTHNVKFFKLDIFNKLVFWKRSLYIKYI